MTALQEAREQMILSLEFVRKREAKVEELRRELDEAEILLAGSREVYDRHKAEYEALKGKRKS